MIYLLNLNQLGESGWPSPPSPLEFLDFAMLTKDDKVSSSKTLKYTKIFNGNIQHTFNRIENRTVFCRPQHLDCQIEWLWIVFATSTTTNIEMHLEETPFLWPIASWRLARAPGVARSQSGSSESKCVPFVRIALIVCICMYLYSFSVLISQVFTVMYIIYMIWFIFTYVYIYIIVYIYYTCMFIRCIQNMYNEMWCDVL